MIGETSTAQLASAFITAVQGKHEETHPEIAFLDLFNKKGRNYQEALKTVLQSLKGTEYQGAQPSEIELLNEIKVKSKPVAAAIVSALPLIAKNRAPA